MEPTDLLGLDSILQALSNNIIVLLSLAWGVYAGIKIMYMYSKNIATKGELKTLDNKLDDLKKDTDKRITRIQDRLYELPKD